MENTCEHSPRTEAFIALLRDYEFLSGDQERLERTRREALAEVEALRAVLSDIADEIFPKPEIRAMLMRDGQGWRKPMMQAIAGMPIAPQSEPAQ